MANFTFDTLKGWSLDTFCVQDYVGYIHNQHSKNSNVPLVKAGEYFAGLVLFDGDTEETVMSFLKMCKVAGVSILRIDFSNITLTDEGKNSSSGLEIPLSMSLVQSIKTLNLTNLASLGDFRAIVAVAKLQRDLITGTSYRQWIKQI